MRGRAWRRSWTSGSRIGGRDDRLASRGRPEWTDRARPHTGIPLLFRYTVLRPSDPLNLRTKREKSPRHREKIAKENAHTNGDPEQHIPG